MELGEAIEELERIIKYLKPCSPSYCMECGVTREALTRVVEEVISYDEE